MNQLMLRIVRPLFSAALIAPGLMVQSGCASLPFPSTERVVDDAKIQAVERAARSRGVKVHWVNYPVK